MGKLLTGHYGEAPEAESVPLSLTECNQKLGLKPSDFVSEGPPKFFEKSFGSGGRYMVYVIEPEDVLINPIWKPGYYLLPKDAADVVRALERNRKGIASADRKILPIEMEADKTPPDDVKTRLDLWVSQCQPLFFECKCDHLELLLKAPWGIRRQWKARLRCPAKCQPALTTLL